MHHGILKVEMSAYQYHRVQCIWEWYSQKVLLDLCLFSATGAHPVQAKIHPTLVSYSTMSVRRVFPCSVTGLNRPKESYTGAIL